MIDFFVLFVAEKQRDAYDSPASARSSARSRSASTMANLRATCINDTHTVSFYVSFLSLFFRPVTRLALSLLLSLSVSRASSCPDQGIWAKIGDLAPRSCRHRRPTVEITAFPTWLRQLEEFAPFLFKCLVVPSTSLGLVFFLFRNDVSNLDELPN